MVECNSIKCSCGDPKHTVHFVQKTIPSRIIKCDCGDPTVHFVQKTIPSQTTKLLYLPVVRIWSYEEEPGFSNILKRTISTIHGKRLELQPCATISKKDQPVFWDLANRYGIDIFLRLQTQTNGEFLYFHNVFLKSVMTMEWCGAIKYLITGECEGYLVWDCSNAPMDIKLVGWVRDVEKSMTTLLCEEENQYVTNQHQID